MKYQWVKPDRELSLARRKEGLWQNGERKFTETGVSDFGDMSGANTF